MPITGNIWMMFWCVRYCVQISCVQLVVFFYHLPITLAVFHYALLKIFGHQLEVLHSAHPPTPGENSHKQGSNSLRETSFSLSFSISFSLSHFPSLSLFLTHTNTAYANTHPHTHKHVVAPWDSLRGLSA